MTYKLTNSDFILRSDGACIPAGPANSDYAANPDVAAIL